MKKYFFITTLVMGLCGVLFPADTRAENQAEKYLGERIMYLDVVRIKETRILDDQTILFETLGGAVYVNRLPVKCPNLWISGGFGYATSNEKISKLDSIETLEQGSGLGNICMLGEFVRFNLEGDLNDAEKLLKDGLLAELVSENAFQEAFPAEQ